MNAERTTEYRVRFAPSPTGDLHIGGVRTAIFCYLFARHNRGKFLLRIEDTDRSRSKEEYVRRILDGLSWLGLDWDEDIYYQSKSREVHLDNAIRLLENRKSYYCYCDQAELAEKRKQAEERGEGYKYDRTCLSLSEEEREALDAAGKPRAMRFLVPEGETVFTDGVHGDIRVSNAELDDFVLLRSDGSPTYHMAVVSDDASMDITHIIRGDDHISNTPKQILLYRALGFREPEFAHLPLIFGMNKKKLSKRHGSVALFEYGDRGFLSGAVFNYLAMLGWVPDDTREVFTKDELIERFDITGIAKKNAIFDEAKLIWYNDQYISAMPDGDLLKDVSELFIRYGVLAAAEAVRCKERLLRMIGMLKSRIRLMPEFVTYGSYFFRDPSHFDEKASKKYWDRDAMNLLEKAAEELACLEPYTLLTTEACIRTLAENEGVKAAALIHPVRLAITGFGVSPGLFEVMMELGRETVVRRIRKAVQYYNHYEKHE